MISMEQIEQLPEARQSLTIENAIFSYTLNHYGIDVRWDSRKYPDYYTQEFIDKVTARGIHLEETCGYKTAWAGMMLLTEFFQKEDAPVFFNGTEL